MERAIEWMLAFENEEMGDVERRQFVAWLKSSPMHVDEFLHVSALHETLTGLSEFSDIKQLVNEVHGVVVPMPDQPAPRQAEQNDTETVRVGHAHVIDANAKGKRLDWNRLIASTAALFVAVAAIQLAVFDDTTYRTLSGETRSIILEDGSRIHLDAESEIRVRITDAARFAEVVHGEVLFAVEPDAERPFSVDAGDLVVHILGTRFSVRRDHLEDAERTELTVIEGHVSVATGTLDIDAQTRSPNPVGHLTDAAEPEANKRDVRAHAFNVSGGDQITVTNDVDTHEATLVARIEDRLVFKNTPLSQVVEIWNRQAEQHLVVKTPSLASKSITATFNAGDSDALLNFIMRQPGVRAERMGNTIYIHVETRSRVVPRINVP